ncbi:MAG: hypothetical protein ACUVXG_08675 [Anaerolineae bacterium]
MGFVGRRALLTALAVGFGLGLAAALYLTWMVWPVEVAGSVPYHLEPTAREGYLILVAEAYDYDGNLSLARERLATVAQPGEDPAALLAALTKRYLDEGLDLWTLRKLVRLTHALGASTSEMLVYLPADSPTPTRTPTPDILAARAATATALLARPPAEPTATATPAPKYLLVERRRICNPGEGPGQVQVVVQDAEGRELPGVRLGLAWPEGGETFFTGFQPEHGEGYADAWMDHPGEYRITVLQDSGGEVVGGLQAGVEAAGCPAEARSVIWQVVFQRIEPPM